VSRGLYRDGGALAFYRGVTPPLLVNTTKRGVQMCLWEELVPRCGGSNAVAGAVAGILGTALSCPLHVVKIQTQTAAVAAVPNAWECAKRIGRSEGVRGFYRGLMMHAIRDGLFAGVFLGVYGTLRPAAQRHRAANDGHANILLQLAGVVGAGAVASSFTWAVMLPLDTLKTVAQSADGSWATVAAKVRHDGVAKLWRGVGPALLRAGPVTGLSMVIYENLRPV
jgi:hypothetical protein